MPTYIVKIECEIPEAMYDALESLVEEQGASFYTLTVDCEPIREWSPHLWIEHAEAQAISLALDTVYDNLEEIRRHTQGR